MKKSLIIIFITLLCQLSYSQSLTKREIKDKLTGTWLLMYQNDTAIDSKSIVKERIYKLNRSKGQEIGIWKNGDTTRQSIKWKFIGQDKNGNFEIKFIGGFWANNQEFSIKNISKNKIIMLSCDKYDCTEAYLIRR